MKRSTIYDCITIELPLFNGDNGYLATVENKKHIPFDIQRIYYLYDVPAGETRGGHSHKNLKQLFVSASGSFDVVLFDGQVKRTITLNRPYHGLYIAPGIWRELENFSSGSVCLVLASKEYDENDYIRNYNDFLNYKLHV